VGRSSVSDRRRTRLLAGAGLVFALTFALGSRRGEERAPARLLSDADGALAELLVHYTPEAAGYVLPCYADFFRALPPEVRVRVACPDREAFAGFLKAMKKSGVPAPERFRPLVMGAPITPWAKDRFVVQASATKGAPAVILVPPRPEETSRARRNDWWVSWYLGRRYAGRYTVRRARMLFDGGDLAASEDVVFADANLLAKNVGALFRSREEFIAYLAAETGKRVVLLGEAPGDVPEHHIGMYLAPLGRKTVAVGDAGLAAKLLREAGREGLLTELGADLSPERVARFANPARLLEEQGFRVVRLPLLPLSTPKVFVTYTNLVMERREGRGIVYLPVYGIDVLDAAARSTFEAEGFEVRPVDVSAVYACRGSLRCLVNVLARQQ